MPSEGVAKVRQGLAISHDYIQSEKGNNKTVGVRV